MSLLNFVNIGRQEIFILLVALIAFAGYVYGLIHVMRNRNLSTIVKLLWILVILSAPFLGLALYWVWGNQAQESVE